MLLSTSVGGAVRGGWPQRGSKSMIGVGRREGGREVRQRSWVFLYDRCEVIVASSCYALCRCGLLQWGMMCVEGEKMGRCYRESERDGSKSNSVVVGRYIQWELYEVRKLLTLNANLYKADTSFKQTSFKWSLFQRSSCICKIIRLFLTDTSLQIIQMTMLSVRPREFYGISICI